MQAIAVATIPPAVGIVEALENTHDRRAVDCGIDEGTKVKIKLTVLDDAIAVAISAAEGQMVAVGTAAALGKSTRWKGSGLQE